VLIDKTSGVIEKNDVLAPEAAEIVNNFFIG
jgi:hypothetical protein